MKYKWKEVQEDGKRKARWDGNGKRKSWELEREKREIIDNFFSSFLD